MNGTKTGLVMEGGSMRGMFTCGVIDVFLEEGITFDGAVGTSAGAVFGCNIKSKQHGRALRYNKKYCSDKRYVSWSNLFRTGNLFGLDFCYRRIPYELDIWDEKTYTENPMEFYAVSTDVMTGKPVYHNCAKGDAEDIQWFRASAAMPLFANVVEIGDRRLLDGGVGDSIALKFFESKGYNRNVVILTQPRGFVKKKNKMLPLAKLMLGRYPELIKAMADRHIRYNETTAYIAEREAAGDVFVIAPPESLNIGAMEKDPEELERVYQIGRKAALDKLEALKSFMK